MRKKWHFAKDAKRRKKNVKWQQKERYKIKFIVWLPAYCMLLFLFLSTLPVHKHLYVLWLTTAVKTVSYTVATAGLAQCCRPWHSKLYGERICKVIETLETTLNHEKGESLVLALIIIIQHFLFHALFLFIRKTCDLPMQW